MSLSIPSLTNESITFGKYEGKNLSDLLKDRKYCSWLLDQNWFQNRYSYLYNSIKNYNPSSFFIKSTGDINSENFIENYTYFNLKSLEELDITLSQHDKICYEFYLKIIHDLKLQILKRRENKMENIYDIKAPYNWLQIFEKNGLSRDKFKDFLYSNDLPNIPYIIEAIKKVGGIEYKGAISFNIAKHRSEKQELWWENKLKNKYGNDVGTQFKYMNCIFDFILIKSNTIYECKLGIKDFNKEQFHKYNITLNKYNIVYLIDKDCIINIQDKKIYTTDNTCKYIFRKYNTPFDDILVNFEVVNICDLNSYI